MSLRAKEAPKFKIKEDKGTRYIVGAKRTRMLKEYREEVKAKGTIPSWNVKKGKLTQKKEHAPALPQPQPAYQPPEKAIEEAKPSVLTTRTLPILIVGVVIVIIILVVFG